MNRTVLSLIFFFLMVPSQAEQRLTKAEVTKILNSVTAAAQARDIEGVMQHFATDAVIILQTEGRSYPMTTEQYRAQTVQGWKQMPKSTLEIKNIQIKLSPDGKKATATDVSVETADLDGRKIKAETHETAEIELVDGVPKNKKLTDVMQMQK